MCEPCSFESNLKVTVCLGPSQLLVVLMQARDLRSADDNGLSDPYAYLYCNNQIKRSKVVRKSLNPQWLESFTFVVTNPRRELSIYVEDHDDRTPE